MRRFLKNMLPDEESFKTGVMRKILAKIGTENNSMFRFNRRTVSIGLAVGLFWAWIPLPLQMLGAVVTALRFKSNIAVAVLGVWLTNPITLIPMFYGAYRFGALLLGVDASLAQPNHHSIGAFLQTAWVPLGLGSMVFAILSAVVAYGLIQLLWALTYYRRKKKNIRFKQAMLARKPALKPRSKRRR